MKTEIKDQIGKWRLKTEKDSGGYNVKKMVGNCNCHRKNIERRSKKMEEKNKNLRREWRKKIYLKKTGKNGGKRHI